MPSVKEMVQQYLAIMHKDGLYNTDGDCACLVNDLSPGDCMTEECRAGYKEECAPSPDIDTACDHECSAGGWHVQEKKPSCGNGSDCDGAECLGCNRCVNHCKCKERKE